MPNQLVDSEAKLKALLTEMQGRLNPPQLVFLDLEGVNLSSKGTIAIMQVLLPPNQTVYLVDVFLLGGKAFSVGNSSGTTLRSILESPKIPKVFFDVRNDSNALFGHYQINLRCVIDIQILEYATRSHRGRFVNGLKRCISSESRLLPLFSLEWAKTKEKGLQLFAPERGGKYEVFLQRPLPKEIIDYCEQDVIMMPGLLAIYARRLEPHVSVQIQEIVDGRIRLSQSSSYNGEGRHKAVGPVLAARRAIRSPDLSFPMSMVCSSKVDDLCRLKVAPDPIPTARLVPDSTGAAPAHTSVKSASDFIGNATQPASGRSAVNVSTRPTRANAEDYDELIFGSDFDDAFEYDCLYDDAFEHDYLYSDIDLGFDQDFDQDFTACDTDCGFCGHCDY